MPRNGTGTYALPTGNPVVDGTSIDPSVHNTTMNDLGAEVTNSVARDGQAAMTGALDMGSQRVKNVASATLRSDAVNLGQVQDGSFLYVGTVGGTANAITLTPSPAVPAYAAGQSFAFKAAAANTGGVTVAISGLAAQSITKRGTAALVSGDIANGAVVFITYDGTQFQLDRVGDVVTKTGTETLTSKTLTNPTINGATLTGTISGGTHTSTTLTSPVINTGVSGTAVASKTNMEAANSTTLIVTPENQIYHPAHAKVWAAVTFSGGTPSATGHGITGVTDGGTGITTVNFVSSFSNSSYAPLVTPLEADVGQIVVTSRTTSGVTVRTLEGSASQNAADRNFSIVIFGDQ